MEELEDIAGSCTIVDSKSPLQRHTLPGWRKSGHHGEKLGMEPQSQAERLAPLHDIGNCCPEEILVAQKLTRKNSR